MLDVQWGLGVTRHLLDVLPCACLLGQVRQRATELLDLGSVESLDRLCGRLSRGRPDQTCEQVNGRRLTFACGPRVIGGGGQGEESARSGRDVRRSFPWVWLAAAQEPSPATDEKDDADRRGRDDTGDTIEVVPDITPTHAKDVAQGYKRGGGDRLA